MEKIGSDPPLDKEKNFDPPLDKIRSALTEYNCDYVMAINSKLQQ